MQQIADWLEKLGIAQHLAKQHGDHPFQRAPARHSVPLHHLAVGGRR
jgi:hypothetical protein